MLMRENLTTKKLMLIVLTLLVTSVLIFICMTSRANASNAVAARDMKVKSIEILPGDTLWEIASANYSDEFGSIKNYVKKIKESNQLKTDSIHTGMYLIIPYYN